jgi:mono/diheme cytochrome c family protein
VDRSLQFSPALVAYASLLIASLFCNVPAGAQGSAERGAYLAIAAGCKSCHTDTENDGASYAGGHRLETPMGDFYTPNITPDSSTGIGNWTEAEFVAAVRYGRNPAGGYYYPAFPYASYAGMTEQDARDIKAYLDTLESVTAVNAENQLAWYVPARWAMTIWQWLYAPWEYAEPTTTQDAEWQRGAYLVRHLGHCGECHTPRNSLGALDTEQELAGGARPDDEDTAPNLTASGNNGIGRWSAKDLEFFLEMGMYPDGDFVGGNMVAVIDDNTAELTAADRRAIGNFLRSLNRPSNEN